MIKVTLKELKKEIQLMGFQINIKQFFNKLAELRLRINFSKETIEKERLIRNLLGLYKIGKDLFEDDRTTKTKLITQFNRDLTLFYNCKFLEPEEILSNTDRDAIQLDKDTKDRNEWIKDLFFGDTETNKVVPLNLPVQHEFKKASGLITKYSSHSEGYDKAFDDYISNLV